MDASRHQHPAGSPSNERERREPDAVPLELLHPDPRRRRSGIVRVPDSEPGRYALRELLLRDPDATCRARAAERIGLLCRNDGLGAVAGWLVEACGDPRLSVRDAAFRALARIAARAASHDNGGGAGGDDREVIEAATSSARRACTGDPAWTVRRSATYALASLAGVRVTDSLLAVLDDPFWRVRHAAIRALLVLGCEREPIRRRVLAAPARTPAAAAAVEYLRRTWCGHGSEPARPRTASAAEVDDARRIPERGQDRALDRADALWDPDPAVITARLEDPARPVSAIALIEHLADPHEPLREAAAARLRAHDDPRALRAALLWVDEPRIPRAADAVSALLDGLGDRALALASEVLGDGASATSGPNRGDRCDQADRAAARDEDDDEQRYGPGAVTWALGWAARADADHLLPAALAHTGSAHASVRAAAMSALDALRAAARDPDARARALAALIRGASDPAIDVRAAALTALVRISDISDQPAIARALTSAARAAFAHTDKEPRNASEPTAAQAAAPVAVRRLLVAWIASRRDARWLALIAESAGRDGDADPWCRALAVRALADLDALDPAIRAACAGSSDPWLRAAALDVTGALAALADDPDPWVRRAAAAWLANRRASLTDAERTHAAARAARNRDPRIRADGCALLDPTRPHELAALLRLSGNRTLMVRAAAADPLAACPDLDDRLRALLASTGERESDPAVRVPAYTWLTRRFDADAEALLRRALAAPDEPDEVRAHARTILCAISPDGASEARPPAIRDAAPIRVDAPAASDHDDAAGEAPPRRALAGIAVSPLAISGAFELTASAYADAHRAGANLFFWEPRHVALTRFLRDRSRRREVVIAAGSYGGSARSVEADVDAALRRLRTDYLDIFLLFWVRSPARIADEARASMRALVRSGKVRAVGFSTHDRALAARAIALPAADAAAGDGPWDVVMVRHSAAHPGAEREVLPVARARGTGVLTFSAICYGRMLAARPGATWRPTAADCYRYSLSQDGVGAVISAPRRRRELAENLAVLARPELTEAEAEALRAHGGWVREYSRDFNALIRREPSPAAESGATPMTRLVEAPWDETPGEPAPAADISAARG